MKRTLPILITLYLVLVLFWAARLATLAWPGNPFVRPYYTLEHERWSILEVTADSVAALQRALVLASRLPEPPGRETLTQAELDHLTLQIATARELIAVGATAASPPLPSIPANIRDWTAGHARYVRQSILEPAIQRLHQRELTLRTCPCSETCRHAADTPTDGGRSVLCEKPIGLLRILVWSLPEPPLLVVDPPLTPAETLRVARLQQTRANKNSDAAPRPSALSPATESADSAADAPAAPPTIDAPLGHLLGHPELELVLLFAAIGAIGACVQSIASLARYLGVDRFKHSWALFYFTRPVIGAALGPLFYLVLRGGLFGEQADYTSLNLFGYAAVAALVGFCATEAMENLREVGGAFFRRKQGKDNADSIDPEIASFAAGVGALGAVISGTGFRDTSRLLVDGVETPVTYSGPNVLRFTLTAAHLARPTLRLQVVNAGGSGGISNEYIHRAVAPDAPERPPPVEAVP